MMHPKGVLIEKCQNLGLAKPEFDTKRTGPEHEPTFLTDVVIEGHVYGTGQGANKKESEKYASEEALGMLEREGVPSKTPKAAPSPARAGVATAAPMPMYEEEFEGPWPIFPEVLAASLNVANSRIDARLKGERAIKEISNLANQLYKLSLESIGEVVEEDEDSDD